MTNKIEWLSVLRGLNILLVVMYHVRLIDFSTGENQLFCEYISAPFTPFRIALFIFISGGLLYLSRIKKEWSVKDLYIDKAQRILIPFVFFVCVYYLLKIVFGALVKTAVTPSWGNFLESFYLFPGHPSAPLWFLATLSVLMLLYPLFKWLCKHHIAMIGFIVFCCVIYFVDFLSLSDHKENYFYLFSLNKYLVFFFAGIMFFRYNVYQYINRIPLLLLFIVLYVVSYLLEIPLFTSLMGILMMCSLCLVVARWYPRLFGGISDYIFQIYLMSFIFQAFVELILWKKLCYHESLLILFYIMNVAAGVLIPVYIAKLVNHCPWKWLRLCFGLK